MATILVADDDLEIVNALQDELQVKGYFVVTANNGHIAFQMAKRYKPDLILLDVAMPMASGIKTLELLRTTPETHRIPVIFLTSLPSADVYPAVEQSHRVAYLKKPIDFEDLFSLMKQFLD